MQGLEQVDPIGLIYAQVGGEKPFFRLAEEFYKGVEASPILRPMYPQELTEPKRKLALFLIQRTGGNQTYSEERGHPRMRGRHLPFKIGQSQRDAWMQIMTQALEQVPEFAPHKDLLHEFFEGFSTFMINQPD